MEKKAVLASRLLNIGWLGLWVWGCSPSPPISPPHPATVSVTLPPLTQPPATPQPTLQVAPRRPQPARPTRPDRPVTQTKKPIVAVTARPLLPSPPAVPSSHHSNRRKPGVAAAPTEVPSPTQTPGDDPGPVEIELVPPDDTSVMPPPAEDPQAILRTPLAVHFGYSYCSSLKNLIRDGVIQIRLLGSGYTSLEISVVNLGLRPLHFFLFPGMICKPEATTTYASLMLADVHEVFLYPGSRENFRVQGYSLDHRKPLPDERFPVLYRLEPERDPRYPKALLVMRALLTEDAAAPDRSDDYGKNRSTIVQMALWQAAAGRYNPDSELSRLLGPTDPKEFQALRRLVYSEAEKLNRQANQF